MFACLVIIAIKLEKCLELSKNSFYKLLATFTNETPPEVLFQKISLAQILPRVKVENPQKQAIYYAKRKTSDFKVSFKGLKILDSNLLRNETCICSKIGGFLLTFMYFFKTSKITLL